ncbi:MAG: hypothetical protein RL760_881 [Candidatus Eisenbacteria bacterium]|jgi:nucleoside-specific outer membrane channel protein Tsx
MSTVMRTLLLAIALMLAALPATAAPARSAAKAHSTASAWHPAVPFIEDDFGRALALAKSRKLPVFIEGWAPW